MVTAIPVEIARMIVGYVEDKKSLLNLSLISHAFRRLTDPYLYSDVSFLAPHKGRSDADLLAVAHSFLLRITSGEGHCAHHVKRIRLPAVAFQGEQCSSFQTILKSIPNLEDLQVHSSWWVESENTLNFRTFFNDPDGPRPIPFTLKAFAWYPHMVPLDSAGLEWFLACQQSLELLLIASFTLESSFRIPALPRLRVLDAPISCAKRLLETHRVTHVKLLGEEFLQLDSAALRDVVVCVTRIAALKELSAAIIGMRNLECLEMDTSCSSIPNTLSQINAFKCAVKLRHLRFFPNQAIPQSGFKEWFEEDPWNYDDVCDAFDSLPQLVHISFRMRSTTFLEYCCFTRGEQHPVKLRSLRPGVSREYTEWWTNWIKDYVVVPFEPEDIRMGYQGDWLGVGGRVLNNQSQEDQIEAVEGSSSEGSSP
ncbi:hypothetical protein PLEOSDRAFT_1107978 [Pleurotus ostreatus PC15]|uniref:F-box domain-containing protein n=1 Tax=Pleurotus ostreatus (strain PC15) TaxID=1137138 RepID=A0A067NN65_PLEO1|nr:hypothetical protein PLEOSDRAFT_1107978 [Pleurotus ostreatus PC15]